MKFEKCESLDKAYFIKDYQIELVDGKLDLPKLLQAFQNLAISQIDALGMGDKFEDENSFMYIVLRYKGVFLEEISNKKYRILTYPMQATTLQMYRYFALIDEEDNIIMYLSSLWVMVDSHTRRIKPAKVFKEKLSDVIDGIENIKPITDDILVNFPVDLEKGKFEYKYIIKKEDIDGNGHMNNVIYLSLATKLLDDSPVSYEINYEKECFYGETLNIYSYTIDNSIYIYGLKEDGSLSFKFFSRF